MDQIFQSLDKNIYIIQNQDLILKSLVSQRKLYNYAKCLNYVYFSVCVVLPLVYSILKTYFSGEAFLAAGSLITVILMLLSQIISEQCKIAKQKAAKIQQTIDFILFKNDTFKSVDDDWGKLYTKDELCVLNAKLKSNKKEIEKVRNWYSDYSKLSHIKQVFYSQCECVRWDDSLRNSFGIFLAFLISILFISIIIFAVSLKMSVSEFLISIATLSPIIQYSITVFIQLKKDENRLKEIYDLQKYVSQNNLYKPDDILFYKRVIKIQNKIYEHRENAFLIPNSFYKILKKRQQRIEFEISVQKQSEDKNDIRNKKPN